MMAADLLTLILAGITHCFVNLGSDHPSIIEAIFKGQKERRDHFLQSSTRKHHLRHRSPDKHLLRRRPAPATHPRDMAQLRPRRPRLEWWRDSRYQARCRPEALRMPDRRGRDVPLLCAEQRVLDQSALQFTSPDHRAE